MVEPTVESVSKGAKDSFVENYRTNTATIRRKIKTESLTIESIVIGKQTKTPVGIVFMKNIVNDEMIQTVRDRLAKVDTDSAISTSIIEDALSDNINTTFPLVLATERPDKFSADVLEGRVGIIVDGLPFAFIVPATFNQIMQAPEDYSHKYVISSAVRLIRFSALLITIMLPALYIAIATFHPEMIPTNLVLFLAKSREGITFPIAFETIIMLLSFEILFEAGLRVPKNIGQAVSIVGTLVIGQAAAEAKLVSPAIVVIIAMTAISAFTIPNQDLSNSVRIWRLIITVGATFLGLLGFVMVVIILIFELCKLESFKVSYLDPFVSQDGKDNFNDTLTRIPLKNNKKRPIGLEPKNIKRQES